MHITKVFWRDSEFFLECTIKTGIVTEAKHMIGLGDIHFIGNGFFAKEKPFFCDKLMNRKSDVLLEYMGNMIFAHIKFLG